MKRLFSFLMVTVLVVSMLTATAFAADSPHTATLTVTGLSGDVHTGDTVTVTITITGVNSEMIASATVDVEASGLKYVSSESNFTATNYAMVSATENVCLISAADPYATNSVSWTYTYEVTAETGKEVSFTADAWECHTISTVDSGAAITINGGKSDVTLTNTVKAAEVTPPTPTVDKTALNADITEAEKVDETEYTAESYAKLKAALTAAKAVAADTAATQDDVDDAVEALEAARKALVEKATEPTTKPTQPTQPSGPDLSRPSGGNQPGQSLVPSGTTAPTTPEKDEVPKTADATTQVWPLAVMMVLSAAGVAVLVRKRNGK